jgi:hypothetical protein
MTAIETLKQEAMKSVYNMPIGDYDAMWEELDRLSGEISTLSSDVDEPAPYQGAGLRNRPQIEEDDMTAHDEQRKAKMPCVRRCRGWCKPKVHVNPRYWVPEHVEEWIDETVEVLGHWVEASSYWRPDVTFTDTTCPDCNHQLRVDAGLPV